MACEGPVDGSLEAQVKATAASPRSRVLPLVMGGIAASSVISGAAAAATLQVVVYEVRNTNGLVDICVFPNDRGFPDCTKDADVPSRRQPAIRGTMRFAFDVPPGLHAVSVLHDENGNGHLDTNFIGIPREGAGVSNNPPPRRGPPRFDEAAFRLPPEGGRITVRLVYP